MFLRDPQGVVLFGVVDTAKWEADQMRERKREEDKAKRDKVKEEERQERNRKKRPLVRIALKPVVKKAKEERREGDDKQWLHVPLPETHAWSVAQEKRKMRSNTGAGAWNATHVIEWDVAGAHAARRGRPAKQAAPESAFSSALVGTKQGPL